MRAISALQQAVRDSGVQSDHVRVSIKDSGGTFRDLTTYPGFNAIKTVAWNGDVEDPHTTCDLTLHREMFKLSLAPFIGASGLNRGYDQSASPVALIAENRELLIEVAIVPMDKLPSSGDWLEVFRGRVDSIDSASGYDIKVGARDLGGRLAQQYIKTELVYSYAAVAGVSKPLRIWEPQIAVVNNVTYCLPASRGTTDPGVNKFFKCSQSGTTGTAEPVWTTGTNQTDGTAKWDYVAAPTTAGNPVEQVMQNILDDHKASGDPTVTLYTPASPSWAIRQYLQRREMVLDAVRTLARQIGWDVRYKWRTGTAQFEFTFLTPTRVSPSVDFTFGVADYEDPKKLATDIATIRNSWRVIYSDASDLFPDGSPKRKTIDVSDGASITKYGELWAEIQEDEASNIDSSTEATALVTAALSDCKEPTAEMTVLLTHGFPWVEVNDYYTFTANGLHFDADQSLAVTGWSHSYTAGESIQSTLNVRGLPTLGARGWLDMTVHPAQPPASNYPPRFQHFNGTETPVLTLTPMVGGALATVGATTLGTVVSEDDAEFHIYPISGTVLDGTTLKTVGKTHNKATHSHGDLVPGKTYYSKVVPRSRDHNKIIRGQPSAEVSFVAGRAKAGHYDSTCTQSHLPLNGNFEHALDDLNDFPFDHWNVVTRSGETPEVWGAAGSVFWDSSPTTKGNFVQLLDSATQRGNLVSDAFEVRRAIRSMNMYISIRRQGSSAASGKDLIVDLVGYSDAELTNMIVNNSVFLSGDAAGPFPSLNVWYDHALSITAALGVFGSSVNFLTVGIRRGTTGNNSFSWEVGDIYTQEADFKALSVDAGGIAQESWLALSFNSGWADFGSGFITGKVFKDANGRVQVRGSVAYGAADPPPVIATLPAGYRPSAKVQFNVWSFATSTMQSIVIQTNGDMTYSGLLADAVQVDLNGISFDTRA